MPASGAASPAASSKRPSRRPARCTRPPAFRDEDRASIHAAIAAAGLATLVTVTGAGADRARRCRCSSRPTRGRSARSTAISPRRTRRRARAGRARRWRSSPGPTPMSRRAGTRRRPSTGGSCRRGTMPPIHAYGVAEFYRRPGAPARPSSRALTDAPRGRPRRALGGRRRARGLRREPSCAGIVGLRLAIARLEGKRKFSQNRSADDRAGCCGGAEGGRRGRGRRADPALSWRAQAALRADRRLRAAPTGRRPTGSGGSCAGSLRRRLPGDRLSPSSSRSRSGATEVASAIVVGWLIDLAQSRGPAGPDRRRAGRALVGASLFFLVLRPVLMGLSAALTALTLGPNLYPLVLSRLNRHTLGQALSFFDDDFAGRIAAEAAADRAGDHRRGQRVGQHPRPRGDRDRRRGGGGGPGQRLARRSRWSSGSPSYVVLIRHYMPRIRSQLQGAGGGAGGGDRAGRRLRSPTSRRSSSSATAMHEDRGDARRPRRLPRRDDPLRRDQRRLPLLADDAGRHAAGAADRRHAAALDPRRGDGRRHRHRRR